jgi:teichuronic acid biosynthesis glycosyltransferase TuaG
MADSGRYKVIEMNELVTVIIPAYRHEQYVREAIQSVLTQTYRNWELILIDDNSPDNTYQVACDLLANEDRATLIKKEQNRGLVDSLNIGIAKARGKYISFLASDDAWLPGFLEISMGVANEHPSAIVFSEAVGSKGYFKNGGIITAAKMHKVLLKTNPVLSVGCLYPAEFLKGLIDIDTSIYMEDYFIRWHSVFAGFDHYGTRQELVRYRQPVGAMSKNKKKIISARLSLFRCISPNLSWFDRATYFASISYRNLRSIGSILMGR